MPLIGDWSDPVVVLRRRRSTHALPTCVVTDLSGSRRAEASALLASDHVDAAALQTVVLGPGTWNLELAEQKGNRSIRIAQSSPHDVNPESGSSWALASGFRGAATIGVRAPELFPMVQGITIGFTVVKITGMFPGSSAGTADLVVRHRDAFELLVPISVMENRFEASLPLDKMAGHDGAWECSFVVDGDAQRARMFRGSRFALSTPVTLVAASGGLLRFRAYTGSHGQLNFSTTTIIEESS